MLDALAKLGRKPSGLKRLILTHGDPDRIGSASAVVGATGSWTYMHAADASPAESGGPFRPLMPGPGLVRPLARRVIYKPNEGVESFRIDQHITDDETLPLAGACGCSTH